MNLNNIVSDSTTSLHEQEWEFPKGRRKLGEKDHKCALREFCEESNIKETDIDLIDSNRYYEEIYQSINKIRYRNIFFLGRYLNTSENVDHYDKNNIHQSKEVRDVQWFSYDQICEKLKYRNKEKHETFKIVHEAVKKSLNKIK